ncbi:hypothetical protein YY92_05590 [Campylobacter fetus]|uniref:hypothetical protein n=1 Tax=Campylobacter fetus TaxID=196 RepID=UPI0011CA9051|nr:hypothetical protein [Campylobacter fetus]EAJ1232372.1 hypothetical protein [Campylobacter fetus]EAK0414199.1 hypothetical protein [Campylobacter fetus]TXF08760.1 hypothetical protein FPD25_04515 [Campylobacter fetus subsp. fetus]
MKYILKAFILLNLAFPSFLFCEVYAPSVFSNRVLKIGDWQKIENYYYTSPTEGYFEFNGYFMKFYYYQQDTDYTFLNYPSESLPEIGSATLSSNAKGTRLYIVKSIESMKNGQYAINKDFNSIYGAAFKCNNGDKLNSSEQCYTDCSDGKTKFGFQDGTCADCSHCTSVSCVAKCYCNFLGSSADTSVVLYPHPDKPNLGLYKCSGIDATIEIPDNLFDDNTTKPEKPEKPDKPDTNSTNPGSGPGDITDPDPVEIGSGSETNPDTNSTNPGSGSEINPDTNSTNPGAGVGSPGSDDKNDEGDVDDYSGLIGEYEKGLEDIDNKFKNGVKTITDAVDSFKSNYTDLIGVLSNGIENTKIGNVVTNCPKTLDLKISNVPKIDIDVCKHISPIKPLTYSIFFLIFSSFFIGVIYRFILAFFI